MPIIDNVTPNYWFDTDDVYMLAKKLGMEANLLADPHPHGVEGIFLQDSEHFPNHLMLQQRILGRLQTALGTKKETSFVYFHVKSEHFVVSVVHLKYDGANQQPTLHFSHYNSRNNPLSADASSTIARDALEKAVQDIPKEVLDAHKLKSPVIKDKIPALILKQNDDSSCGPLALLNAYAGLHGELPSEFQKALDEAKKGPTKIWEDESMHLMAEGAKHARAFLINKIEDQKEQEEFIAKQNKLLPSSSNTLMNHFYDKKPEVKALAKWLSPKRPNALIKSLYQAIYNPDPSNASDAITDLSAKHREKILVTLKAWANNEALKKDAESATKLQQLASLLFDTTLEDLADNAKADQHKFLVLNKEFTAELQQQLYFRMLKSMLRNEIAKKLNIDLSASPMKEEDNKKMKEAYISVKQAVMQDIANGTPPNYANQGDKTAAFKLISAKLRYQEHFYEPCPEHFYIGTGIQGIRTAEGFKINTVFANSPAQELGLMKGKVITHVLALDANGQPIKRNGQFEFIELKGKSEAEMVQLIRGKPHQLRVFKCDNGEMLGNPDLPIYNRWCHAQYECAIDLNQPGKANYESFTMDKIIGKQNGCERLLHLILNGKITDQEFAPIKGYMKRNNKNEVIGFEPELEKAAQLAERHLTIKGKKDDAKLFYEHLIRCLNGQHIYRPSR